MRKLLALSLLAVCATGIANAQYLLVGDSGNDRIMKVDAQTGAMIDENFITDTSGAFNLAIPKGIAHINGQIWVSDQSADSVLRFDESGNFLGETTAGLDNIRGLNQIGNEVWVTSDGSTNNGGKPNSIFRLDLNGNIIGDFTVNGGSPFDVVAYGNEVLIGEIDTEDINRYDTSGNFLGTFHDSDGVTGIDFPQQMHVVGTDVYVAGFSNPAGLYKFDSTGAQVDQWTLTGSLGLRGAHFLGNGNMLVTGGTRMVSLDLVTGTETDLAPSTGGSFQYVAAFDPIPEPATLSIAALGLGALAARRRKNRK